MNNPFQSGSNAKEVPSYARGISIAGIIFVALSCLINFPNPFFVIILQQGAAYDPQGIKDNENDNGKDNDNGNDNNNNTNANANANTNTNTNTDTNTNSDTDTNTDTDTDGEIAWDQYRVQNHAWNLFLGKMKLLMILIYQLGTLNNETKTGQAIFSFFRAL